MRIMTLIPGAKRFVIGHVGAEEYLQHLQTLIGGYVTPCFHTETESGAVYGYCAEEWFGKGNWSVCIGNTLRTDAPYFIGGVVVIGGATVDGEVRDLTDDEIALFALHVPRGDRIPILQRETRAIHPLQYRVGAFRKYVFTRNNLPMGSAVTARKLSMSQRSIGPREDPYTLRSYYVKVYFPDTTWAEWIYESDALAEEDRMYVRTSVSDKKTQVHTLDDNVRGAFEDMCGVRLTRFERMMFRSVGGSYDIEMKGGER